MSNYKKLYKYLFVIMVCVFPMVAGAMDFDLKAFTVEDGDAGQVYSVNLQVLFLMTVLTFLPAMILMMTSFTRIIIVLAILRQALGLQQTPNNQILLGLTMFLTFFIMAPVFDKVYEDAFVSYIEDQSTLQESFSVASIYMKRFMAGEVRDEDLSLFQKLSGVQQEEAAEDYPLNVIIPSFVTSELKTAFQMGFLLFIPFLIIDLVVASVLMAMGMMMLSPLVISLPFKIMLFVMIDGWTLLFGTLASSFAL